MSLDDLLQNVNSCLTYADLLDIPEKYICKTAYNIIHTETQKTVMLIYGKCENIQDINNVTLELDLLDDNENISNILPVLSFFIIILIIIYIIGAF